MLEWLLLWAAASQIVLYAIVDDFGWLVLIHFNFLLLGLLQGALSSVALNTWDLSAWKIQIVPILQVLGCLVLILARCWVDLLLVPCHEHAVGSDGIVLVSTS